MVTAAGVSDRDSVQEVSLRETFYINYNYELLRVLLFMQVSWIINTSQN